MVAALLDETSAHARPGAKSCWFAPDVVERLVAAKTRHEIGTHSGRHIYFDRIGAAEAEDDLGFARTIHRENGLSFTSMVSANEAGQGRIEISTMGSYADRKTSDQGMDAKR